MPYPLGQDCIHQRLLADDASAAVDAGVATSALEGIVEANYLLSALGLEEGGLAAEHAIVNGFSMAAGRRRAHRREKVAIGLHKLLEKDNLKSEIHEMFEFCRRVGLLTSLAQLVVIANAVASAFKAADQRGRAYA